MVQQAIKTYPKRGYQWQSTFETVEPELASVSEPPESGDASSRARSSNLKPGVVVFSLVALAIVMFMVSRMSETPSATKNTPLLNVAYIPFADDAAGEMLQLEDDALFDFTPLQQYNTAEFSLIKEVEYPVLLKQYPLILTGKVRQFGEEFFLDFSLKGVGYSWSGQLVASSQQQLVAMLSRHLHQQGLHDIVLSVQPLEVRQATLTVMHQQMPNDLIVLTHLIESLMDMEDRERAFVLAEKLETLAKSQQNALYIGNSLLLQSRILSYKNLDELSDIKLTQALTYFEATNDLARQSDVLYNQAIQALKQKDYPAVVEHLLAASTLAKQGGDIPRELEALTYLSVLAHKFAQHDDKYRYLEIAEQKMNEYQLASYHFAKVPFHYAIFAQSDAAKLPHYKQVLTFTEAIPDHWIAVHSRLKLVEHYIALEQFAEAQVIVDNLTTDTPENSLLRTLLAKATGNDQAWRQLAKRTFDQAQLAGKMSVSLDVALLLCAEPEEQVNVDFYAQFIHDNATANWRRMNEEKLLALQL